MSADDQTRAPAPAAELQFDKVELPASDAARSCRRCQRPIGDLGEYFELGGSIVCSACASDLGGAAAWREVFPRALLFGAAAAALGTIAWFAIIKLTGTEFGLLAIGVGLFVGMAVRRGARHRGGWRFQTLAMLLTYVSITASYVPLVMRGLEPGVPVPASVYLEIFGLALAGPFLGGTSNIMGIIIIGVALYEAWRMNRGTPLSGPFRLGGQRRPG